MKLKYAVPAFAAVAALALTGCTDNSAEETGGAGGEETANLIDSIEVDEAAAAALPEDIADAGTLIVGTDSAYPPNEFKDPEGNPTGWNVSLVEAIGKKLGVEISWEIAGFDSIIPRVQGGTFDMGSSSFTDTLERQESVDFIDYYDAGSLWAAAAGSDVDPEAACGLTVGVQTGTVQDTDELPTRSQACVDAGEEPIDILKFEEQAEVTQAVIDGRADAMSADSPVTGAAVAASDGALEEAGEIFDAAPYGFIVAKDDPLQEAIQLAVQSLIDDGTYEEILVEAGVDAGAVETVEINAVTE